MKCHSLDNRNLNWDEDKGKGWPCFCNWERKVNIDGNWFSAKGFKLLTWPLTSTTGYNTCKSRENEDAKPQTSSWFWSHFTSFLYSFLQKSILSYRATAVFSVSQGTQYSIWDHLKRHLCIDISWCNCSKCLFLPLSQTQWEPEPQSSVLSLKTCLGEPPRCRSQPPWQAWDPETRAINIVPLHLGLQKQAFLYFKGWGKPASHGSHWSVATCDSIVITVLSIFFHCGCLAEKLFFKTLGKYILLFYNVIAKATWLMT